MLKERDELQGQGQSSEIKRVAQVSYKSKKVTRRDQALKPNSLSRVQRTKTKGCVCVRVLGVVFVSGLV